jgi:hypothetical protein
LWDVIGGSSNTYNSLGDDWETSSSKEKIQFKEKVGDEKFKQANDEFNELFKDWFSEVRLKDEYKKQTDEMKTDIISKKKRELKKTIFQKYGFKARKSKKKIVPNL